MGKTLKTSSLRRVALTRMPTRWGLFEAIGYAQDVTNGSASTNTALAMTFGDLRDVDAPLVRIHSQCFTGEMLGSLRCDCGEQLEVAMQTIAAEGCGLMIYEYQEGLTPGRSDVVQTPGVRTMEGPSRRSAKEKLVSNPQFAAIDEATRALRAGRMVVVVDDEDRENEGDLTMAAEMITPEAINFMATQGRGLVCLAMTGDKLDRLQLGPMIPDNGALGGTAFTVSIDARGEGMTTGISTRERARTIRAAVHANSRPEHLARPGHVFPLRARTGGVLERRGHTEAAVDLARLAGFAPAGVICEVVNDDGTMARVPDLGRFCRKHGLMMITIADLVRYRLHSEYEGGVEGSDQRLRVQQREVA